MQPLVLDTAPLLLLLLEESKTLSGEIVDDDPHVPPVISDAKGEDAMPVAESANSFT